MVERKKLLCLIVTEEQENAIEGIFNFHGWTLERANDENHGCVSSVNEADQANNTDEGEVSRGTVPMRVDYTNCHQNQPETSGHCTERAERCQNNTNAPDGSLECPHCYCRPCITSETNRQLWWPITNSEPSEHNRGIRNKIYKKFWSMMHNRYMWSEPRYLARKIQIRSENITLGISVKLCQIVFWRQQGHGSLKPKQRNILDTHGVMSKPGRWNSIQFL